MIQNKVILGCYLTTMLILLGGCIIKTEPEIPTGATNGSGDPQFESVEIYLDSQGRVQAYALLSERGKLRIQEHGWVWSNFEQPTLGSASFWQLGELNSDAIVNDISALVFQNSNLFLRPFVKNFDGLFYGPETCFVPADQWSTNTADTVFKNALVQFTPPATTTLPETVFWQLGEDETSSLRTPTVLFSKLGRHKISLLLNKGYCHSVQYGFITVVPDPFENYWVKIPAGAFHMGCTPEQASDCQPEENPVHEVQLDSFLLGRTEISQAQWQAVMGSNPSFFNDCPQCPVELVSWETITTKFIPALYRKTGRQYRLPTESEWEYAARGNESYLYAGSDYLQEVAWAFDSDLRTQPVGIKKKNGFGIYDMSGNVFEWCSDYYGPYPSEKQINPPGPSEGAYRVLRGGSYTHFGFLPWRVAARFQGAAIEVQPDWGFRLAKDLD